jgi:hypothetical protein
MKTKGRRRKTFFAHLVFLAACYFVAIARAGAAEPTQFQQSLQAASGVPTKESIEVVDGTRYRRIETTNGVYYLKFLAPDDSTAQIDCGKPVEAASPRRVEGSVRLTKRSRAFVRMLQEACTNEPRPQHVLTLSPQMGVQLEDRPGDAIHDKSIYISPATPNGFGLSGTF